MADVDAWLADLGTALGLSAEEALPPALRDELLGLTGEIAHRVVRLAVPLTSYLVGGRRGARRVTGGRAADRVRAAAAGDCERRLVPG